jgi:hypothetical protein
MLGGELEGDTCRRGPLRGNILVCPFAEYVKRYGEGVERLVFVVPAVVPAVMEAGFVSDISTLNICTCILNCLP